MTDKLWFKPTEGLTVLCHATNAVVPPEGQSVFAHDDYWQRRVMDGDGAFVNPPEPAAPAAPEPAERPVSE